MDLTISREQPRSVHSIQKPRPHRCALELSEDTPFACTAAIDNHMYHKRRVALLSGMCHSLGERYWSSEGDVGYLRRITKSIIITLRNRGIDYVACLAGIQDPDYWHVEQEHLRIHGCQTDRLPLQPQPHRCAFELSKDTPLACTARITCKSFHEKRVAQLEIAAMRHGLSRRCRPTNLRSFRATAQEFATEMTTIGADYVQEALELVYDQDYWKTQAAFLASKGCLADPRRISSTNATKKKRRQPKARANSSHKPGGIRKPSIRSKPTAPAQSTPAARTRSRLDLRSRRIQDLGLVK